LSVKRSGVKICGWIGYVLVLSRKDARPSKRGDVGYLRAGGMPPFDVIRAITVNAAEMLGWQDRIGSVEPGNFADLVAGTGDPIAILPSSSEFDS